MREKRQENQRVQSYWAQSGRELNRALAGLLAWAAGFGALAGGFAAMLAHLFAIIQSAKGLDAMTAGGSTPGALGWEAWVWAIGIWGALPAATLAICAVWARRLDFDGKASKASWGRERFSQWRRAWFGAQIWGRRVSQKACRSGQWRALAPALGLAIAAPLLGFGLSAVAPLMAAGMCLSRAWASMARGMNKRGLSRLGFKKRVEKESS